MKGKLLTFILALIACITIPCGIVGCSTVPPHAHTYGEVTYTWEENDTVCVATRICSLDETHVQTERATATFETTTEATYTQTGSGTAQATFTNPAFETQTKTVVLPKKNALASFDGAQINGNEILYVVSAETKSVNFTDKIIVPEDCTFAVLDPYNDPIENNDTSNLWDLNQGNNTGYKLRITSNGGEQIDYTLTIHRIWEIYVDYYDRTNGESLYGEWVTSAQEYVPDAEKVNELEGYTFNRFTDYYWEDYQTTVLYEHTTIYVDRTPKTYTATFDENAGDKAGLTAEVAYNSVVNFPVPERPGCWFLGWELNGVKITDEYGQGYYGRKWNVAKDNEVVALWGYNYYVINYHLDGGKNNKNNITDYYAYDDAFTLLDPTKENTTVVNSYKTAVFQAEEGSDIKLAGIDYYTNSKIRVDRTSTSFVFDGWYTEDTFENKVAELNFTYGTINLYAKWVEQNPENEVVDLDWLVVDEDGTYNPNGSYLLMGTYPQTIKSADVTIDTTLNGSNGWNVGSDGNLYKEVVANPYVAQVSPRTYYFSDNTAVVKNTTYYFKLEPMRWRILLRPEDGGWTFLMSDKAIDANVFDPSVSPRNPVYQTSLLRQFCTTNFLSMNIPQTVQDVMKSGNLYNNLQSTLEAGSKVPQGWDNSIWNNNPYVSNEEIKDKVYVFSISELTDTDFGFSRYMTTKDTKRQVTPTDYAIARGIAVSSLEGYEGNCSWWTRSPNPTSPAVLTVSADGCLATQDRNSYGIYDVRPDLSFYGYVPSTRLVISSF